MNDFSNLIIRWTFGETAERPTSLQSFDMLNCSLCFVSILFPKAEKYIIYNSLKSKLSLSKLKAIAEDKAILLESDGDFGNTNKNSFWKYNPLRIDKSKHELVLDSDIVFWDIPKIILRWLESESLLINSDWNGRNYGVFEDAIPKGYFLNAGILGYPPDFNFELPDINDFEDTFFSEQGFISNEFINSSRQLLIISKEDVFQSNSEKYLNIKLKGLLDNFSGGHFCGCNYGHFFHWDKYYKEEVWSYYYKLIK